jgi:aldose sugar dehydrogenase
VGHAVLSSLAGLLLAFVSYATCAQQGQPAIGVAAVTLTEESYVFDTAEQHKIRVVVIARGLAHPFALAFLPWGDALLSERGVQMRIVHNATGAGKQATALDPVPVAGVPALVPAYRNGGLHDIVLHPQFAANQLIYFTYNKPADIKAPAAGGPPRQRSAVALMRGKWNGKELTDVEELFVAEPGGNSGSRITFGKDGMVYMTTAGEGGTNEQNLNSSYGKVLRLHDDGRIPNDNPFVGRADAKPQVFSYGHRDHLGLTVHPQTGMILNAEHGPNGGDEVNIILPGRNYGWPKFSFGRNKDGSSVSEMPLAPGIEYPLIVWLPSIAPSGLTVYTGDRFPHWKGNLFIGSARRGEVPRTGSLERVVLDDKMQEMRREALLGDLHQRMRDVRQGPDGLLYVLTDEQDGALLRIEPAE